MDHADRHAHRHTIESIVVTAAAVAVTVALAPTANDPARQGHRRDRVVVVIVVNG
jgi:hypothetical protein